MINGSMHLFCKSCSEFTELKMARLIVEMHIYIYQRIVTIYIYIIHKCIKLYIISIQIPSIYIYNKSVLTLIYSIYLYDLF